MLRLVVVRKQTLVAARNALHAFLGLPFLRLRILLVVHRFEGSPGNSGENLRPVNVESKAAQRSGPALGSLVHEDFSRFSGAWNRLSGDLARFQLEHLRDSALKSGNKRSNRFLVASDLVRRRYDQSVLVIVHERHDLLWLYTHLHSSVCCRD